MDLPAKLGEENFPEKIHCKTEEGRHKLCVFDVSMVSHIAMVSQATQICQWLLPGQN
jgi:hypothetical protein